MVKGKKRSSYFLILTGLSLIKIYKGACVSVFHHSFTCAMLKRLQDNFIN